MSQAKLHIANSHVVSCLTTEKSPWKTAASYQAEVNWGPAKFEEVMNVLLTQPQLNSTHLFRADVLYDSSGILQTPTEKEAAVSVACDRKEGRDNSVVAGQITAWPSPLTATCISSFGLELSRVVIRRLIPRKPKLDRALEQTCFIYREDNGLRETDEQRLVVYQPHVQEPSEMPWYHPSVKALAYKYCGGGSVSSLSVHFLPFSAEDIEPVTDRLHRTMLSLLSTLVRLAKYDKHDYAKIRSDEGLETGTDGIAASNMSVSIGDLSLTPSSLKDTIVPQHLVQDTYTRLKETYASDLIHRWVESTEPSKHVFEDLAIAAFLIELWKKTYPSTTLFPGFVDIACGNGVLTYILLTEGYDGYGFDARRRKTWKILDIDSYLTEKLCIPQPFLDALGSTAPSLLPATPIHNGIFPSATFIISNHADELTPWTPLLACLSSPSSPNPFLTIPCCSHALSGARHRYSPEDIIQTSVSQPDVEQSSTGDLKALRAAKKTCTGGDKSIYGCLTRKVATLAQGLGCSVELTLMRIPSTRNVGIVGNRKYESKKREGHLTVEEVIARECKKSGGTESAARIWVERAQKLQAGSGQGKVNLRRHERGAELRRDDGSCS